MLSIHYNSYRFSNSTGNATEPWVFLRMHIWQTNGINKTAQLTGLTVWLPVTSEGGFQVTRLLHNMTVSQYDHFLLLRMYLLFGTLPGWLLGWKGFFSGGWVGVGVYLDLVGSTQLQCIYYFVPYTYLLAAEGISALQTSLLFRLRHWNYTISCQLKSCLVGWK